MATNLKILNLLWLLVFLELASSRTISHTETTINSNGDKTTRTWTTIENDSAESSLPTFYHKAEPPKAPTFDDSHMESLSPTNEQIEAAAVAKGMDGESIRELLKTKKPVVKTTTTPSGDIQSTTYQILPGGGISSRTVITRKPTMGTTFSKDVFTSKGTNLDDDSPWDDWFKPHNQQPIATNTNMDPSTQSVHKTWKWSSHGMPTVKDSREQNIGTYPSSTLPPLVGKPHQTTQQSPDASDPTNDWEFNPSWPAFKQPTFAKLPKFPETDSWPSFPEEPEIKLPNSWDTNTWRKPFPTETFNNIPTYKGNGDPITETKTYTDDNGRKVTTTYTIKPHSTTQTINRTSTWPEVKPSNFPTFDWEKYLKATTQMTPTSKWANQRPTIATAGTPPTITRNKPVTTINIEDLPMFETSNDGHDFRPVVAGGPAPPLTKVTKIENILPLSESADKATTTTPTSLIDPELESVSFDLDQMHFIDEKPASTTPKAMVITTRKTTPIVTPRPTPRPTPKPRPTTSNNTKKGSNPIDEYLSKVGLSASDLKSKNGEIVKTIIDDDGRILTVSFLLSSIIQNASPMDKPNLKPIK